MANYAALIDVLTIAGSRLSTGAANASGTVYFFQPGGNTPVSVYSDAAATTVVTQPLTLTSGGLVNRTTVPNGIYVTQAVRVLIQDVSGNTVADTVYIPATAGDVGVSNAGWTNDNLDDVLTAIYTSTGGVDGTYLESGGATERTIKSKFSELLISVKDFGAAGDGVAIDTTAIQAAMNRVKALGGGICYFPPGTYLVDQALSLTSATGVSLVGAGVGASIIVTSNTTSNVFELTSCTGFVINGLKVSATADNAASAFVLTTCTYATMRGVLINTDSGGSFLIPVIVTTSSSYIRMDDCDIEGKQADANGRSIRLTNATDVIITGGVLRANAGAAVEFAGATFRVAMFGVGCIAGASGSPKGLLWSATSTGTDFTVVGCQSLREGLGAYVTPFDMSAISTDPRLRQYSNGVDGYAENVTSGGTVTPTRTRGTDIRYTGTTTGAAYTVAAPVPTPAAGATSGMRDTLLRITFNNAAGGAITGWTLNAVYHVASAISTTDTQITVVTFQWDATASVWREISRAVTA